MLAVRPPTPRILQARWQQLSLLELMVIGPDPDPLISMKVDETARVVKGRWNNLIGDYAWFATRLDAQSLLYGGVQIHPKYWERGPKIEDNARRRIADLSEDLLALVEPRHPQSLGWTFAMWAETPDDDWQDLTGEDPNCIEMGRAREALMFLGDDEEVRDWMIEQFELPANGLEETLAILRGEPLTEAIVSVIALKCSRSELLATAQRIGYPIAPELRAKHS